MIDFWFNVLTGMGCRPAIADAWTDVFARVMDEHPFSSDHDLPNFLGQTLHEVAHDARVVDGGADVVEPRHQPVEGVLQGPPRTRFDQSLDFGPKVGHFRREAVAVRGRPSPIGVHFLA